MDREILWYPSFARDGGSPIFLLMIIPMIYGFRILILGDNHRGRYSYAGIS